MEIEGIIIMDLPMQSGVSKAGNEWHKKEWVLETESQYPRKVKFHCFGDRANNLKFEVGKKYRIQVDIESREFNGRWYTDVSAYAATPVDGGVDYQQPQPPVDFGAPAAPAAPAPAAPEPFGGSSDTDDLPF